MAPGKVSTKKTDDEEIRTLQQLLSSKEIVISCGSGGVGKTTTAAALGAMAAAHLGGKVLVLTVDPARRLANALGLERFGNTETRVPDSAFAAAGVEPRGELWAAMLDTKQSWDDLIELPRPRPEGAGGDPRQLDLRQHLGPLRPEPRLHRHGAALRDPHVGPLRPDRRRHPADPERHRLPRRPRPHGRVLLQPPAALAHRPGQEPGPVDGLQALLQGGRRHPGLAVPGGHRRVLQPLPDHGAGLRRAGRGRHPHPLGPPHHLHRGVDAGGGAGPRGRVLHRGAREAASSTSARWCSTRSCPPTCGGRRRPAWPGAW